MIIKLKHYIKETLLFLLFITILSNVISLYKSSELNNNYIDINNSKLIDNSTYIRNTTKPLLVHIWATWCPTCKLEADNIQRLSTQYEVLTISVNSGDKTSVNKYLEDNEFDFRVINDPTGVYAKAFNISAYPTTFIYDKNNKLIFSETGYTSSLGLFFRMLWSDL